MNVIFLTKKKASKLFWILANKNKFFLKVDGVSVSSLSITISCCQAWLVVNARYSVAHLGHLSRFEEKFFITSNGDFACWRRLSELPDNSESSRLRIEDRDYLAQWMSGVIIWPNEVFQLVRAAQKPARAYLLIASDTIRCRTVSLS